MKYPFEMHWDGKKLTIMKESYVNEQLREKFKPGYLDATVEHPFNWKSNEQLGYLFAEIGSKAKAGLEDFGYEVSDKKAAIKFIMEKMDSDRWVDVVKDKFGVVVSRSAKSISALGKRDTYELVVELTTFIQTWMHIDIQSPAEYKELMKTEK